MTDRTFVRTLLALLTAIAFAWSSAAMAETLSRDQRDARLKAIAREVLSANGIVDRKLHDEFWSLLPFSPKVERDVKSAVGRAAMEQILSPMLRASTRFDTEVWTSAKLSADAHQVVKTPGFAAAGRAWLAATLPSARPAVRQNIKKADDIVAAAASGAPMQTPNGPRTITAAVAEQTLGRVAATMARVKRLLDPVWTGA